MSLESLEKALVARGQSLEHLTRCIRVLEREISVCANTDARSQQHYEWIQACQAEIQDVLYLSGRELLLDETAKTAIIVAAVSETTEDDKQMPRAKSYRKQDLENSVLVMGLCSLAQNLEAATKEGRFGSKGEILVDPLSIYQSMEAVFGVAMLSNTAKQKLLFEAFEELGLVSRASGRSSNNSLAEESVIVVLPTIRTLMTPERMKSILDTAERNQEVRQGRVKAVSGHIQSAAESTVFSVTQVQHQ